MNTNDLSILDESYLYELLLDVNIEMVKDHSGIELTREQVSKLITKVDQND